MADDSQPSAEAENAEPSNTEEKSAEDIQEQKEEPEDAIEESKEEPAEEGSIDEKEGHKEEVQPTEEAELTTEQTNEEDGQAVEEVQATDVEVQPKEGDGQPLPKKGGKKTKQKSKEDETPSKKEKGKKKAEKKKAKKSESVVKEGDAEKPETEKVETKHSLTEPAEATSESVLKKQSKSATKSIGPRSSSKSVEKSVSTTVPSKSAEEVQTGQSSEQRVKGKIEKDVTISDLQLEEGGGGTKKKPKKKGKKAKVKKVPSESKDKKSMEEVAQKEAGTESKEKVEEVTRTPSDKKGAKKKDKKTLRKESSVRIKVEPSLEKGLKKEKKSQPSLQQLMTRLSSHNIEMTELKRRSEIMRSSSMWTIGSSSSTESEESDQIEYDKKKSVSGIEPKKRKGKKGKKKKVSSETEVEEGEPKKKKEKKKKKKGKEKVVEAEPQADIEPQEDVLAEVARLKYLAELKTSGEDLDEASTIPETPKKEKKAKKKKKKQEGPKKKLSKKEKARLAAEKAEKAKMSAEEKARQAAELERIRLAEERKAALEKEHREGIEQQVRMETLQGACQQFKDLAAYIDKLNEDAKIQTDWEYYVNCGRLPNPSKCDQMNTYLHLWENMTTDNTTMEEAAQRTKDMLELLDKLTDLIDRGDKDSKLVESWKWVRRRFRVQQEKSINVATYRLLRDIEKNLHRIDIPTADYTYKDDNIALCLWLRIQLPTPLPNPRRPPKPRIEVEFPEIRVHVLFPVAIDGEKIAIRALYFNYDHLSDTSETYDKPPIPPQYDMDLYTAMKKEWRQKMLYKYKNRVRPIKEQAVMLEEGDGTEEEEEEGEDDEVEEEEEAEIPVVPYRKLEPTASHYVIQQEDKLYKDTRTALLKSMPDDVINLRKYIVIGGLYALTLANQPPQPQDFVTLEMTLTSLYLPKEISLCHIDLDFNPPVPPEPNVRRPPEEIEEEMKKMDEELDKLVLINLTWPDNVIYLELPIVCFWDEKRAVWTKKEVYDLKHNEEKGQVSFRIGMGGISGLAVYRYANLPYQAWEMRPEANGTVSLQLTAAILLLEFNVKGTLVALTQLQNSPNNALQDIIGKYYELPKLIRVLQSAGVDVFPAFDAFCYIENTCEKHWPMEKHLYFNMAQMGQVFNFAWSRWNMAAGRRSVVLQMREFNTEKTKQKSHLMANVTPLKALYVDCTEVSQSFNKEGIEGMKFYPDLLHLMKGTAVMAVKDKVSKAPKELVWGCYELLVATRVVSFS